MFKKDDWVTGALIGVLLPLVLYGLTILILGFWGRTEGLLYPPNPQVPGLVGIAANLKVFRYNMVKLKFDRTGRGIILVTFLIFLAIFLFM